MIRDALARQYHAALRMLETAIQRCPAELWDKQGDANRFWLVAYHALFYVHLYLQPTLAAFVPWDKHRDGVQDMSVARSGEAVYSREDVLDYVQICHAQIDTQLARMDLAAASGFDWIPLKKLEHQVYSIRHLQQHAGELCERIKAGANIDVDWIGR